MSNKLLLKAGSLVSGLLLAFSAFAQPSSFPVNGVKDTRLTHYIFINANIYVTPEQLIAGGILEIEGGKIKSVKKQGDRYDTTAIVIDLKGNYIYPSFIDIYSNYGMPETVEKRRRREEPQPESNKKGPYGWNEAIKPEVNAAELFKADAKGAEEYRSLGFGVVAAHGMDGISRGTSVLIDLSEEKENLSIVKTDATANFSFRRGSSTQDYPNSLMGSIALIRQTWYDAQAYERGLFTETNLSLDAWNKEVKQLPLVFEASEKWDIQRINKIGNEFGKEFIIKTAGDEYQNLDYIKAARLKLIVPLNFPSALDIKGYFDEESTGFSDVRHRVWAPFNTFLLQQKNIAFALTLHGLKSKKEFMDNLRKAIQCGLSDTAALRALTITPAQFIKADKQTGTLEVGKLANFIISDGKVFDENSRIIENWVQGKKFIINAKSNSDLSGTFTISEKSDRLFTITLKNKKGKIDATLKDSSYKINKFTYNAESKELEFIITEKEGEWLFSGWVTGNTFSGSGKSAEGRTFYWNADKIKEAEPDTAKPKKQKELPESEITQAYTYADKKTSSYLIRNVTVWTNEQQGIITGADVLVIKGKIMGIGNAGELLNKEKMKAYGVDSVPIINGTGKHLTPGIVDEHSHIAIWGGVNEGSQSVTAEVRIGDVLYPDDINIYRQLAGGVTTSQLLHGSANTIGGQSAVIRLKWGSGPDSLVFAEAPGRIKFALGENVKQSNWGEAFISRFPQTRMGVEQVFVDAFARALEYEKAWDEYKKDKTKKEPKRDIEMEALLEVVNGKRLVTCHSYIQSEINMLMKVAEHFGFRINTFTHVLEGYKIADKLKAHGAGASTFSDWWGYKYEVIEATPYNAALLNKEGVVTCINSDDAEMGRRLNQEAAKTIKYGGVSEQDALKMVTLNPAKQLKIDHLVGSIKAGKQADLVLWSGNPLSVYSKPEKTFIEGVVYFDIQKDKEYKEKMEAEKSALLKHLLEESDEKAKEKPKKEKPKQYHCDDMEVYGEEVAR